MGCVNQKQLKKIHLDMYDISQNLKNHNESLKKLQRMQYSLKNLEDKNNILEMLILKIQLNQIPIFLKNEDKYVKKSIVQEQSINKQKQKTGQLRKVKSAKEIKLTSPDRKNKSKQVNDHSQLKNIKQTQSHILKFKQKGNQKQLSRQLKEVIKYFYQKLIEQKLTQINESKILSKQLTNQISWQIVNLNLRIMQKIVTDKQFHYDKSNFKELHKYQKDFLGFLKRKYPRGDDLDAGDLSKSFRQKDQAYDYENDILNNAGVYFIDDNDIKIKKTIKNLINTLITQTDKYYPIFQKFMRHRIFTKKVIENHSFQISRKIPQNVSKYKMMDTDNIEIFSNSIFRVLIKWIEDLEKIVKKPKQRISQNVQWTFIRKQKGYKPQLIKCSKAQRKTLIQLGLIQKIEENYKKYFQNKSTILKQQVDKLNISLIKAFEDVKQYQPEHLSRQQAQIIKFSQLNMKFYMWVVQQKLIQLIKILIQSSAQIYNKKKLKHRQSYSNNFANLIQNQFQPTLNQQDVYLSLVKFNITDLMRCKFQGNRNQILQIYYHFLNLERQEKIKIIKIKNRFMTEMSDAMIIFKINIKNLEKYDLEDMNVNQEWKNKRFSQKEQFQYRSESQDQKIQNQMLNANNCYLICECQLVLSQKSKLNEKKLKNIEILNHYLYQLQRSPFQAVGQAALELNYKSDILKYSQFVKFGKSQDFSKCKVNKDHIIQQIQVTDQSFPILCSGCWQYYRPFENLSKITECKDCMKYFCYLCTMRINKQIYFTTNNKILTIENSSQQKPQNLTISSSQIHKRQNQIKQQLQKIIKDKNFQYFSKLFSKQHDVSFFVDQKQEDEKSQKSIKSNHSSKSQRQKEQQKIIKSIENNFFDQIQEKYKKDKNLKSNSNSNNLNKKNEVFRDSQEIMPIQTSPFSLPNHSHKKSLNSLKPLASYIIRKQKYKNTINQLEIQKILQNLFQKIIYNINQKIDANKIKISQLIQFFYQNQDYIDQTEEALYFIISSISKNNIVFRGYKYLKNDQKLISIENQDERYEKHEFFEIYEFDILYIPYIEQHNSLSIKKYQQLCEANHLKPIYLFQQLKHMEVDQKCSIQYYLYQSKQKGIKISFIIDIKYDNNTYTPKLTNLKQILRSKRFIYINKNLTDANIYYLSKKTTIQFNYAQKFGQLKIINLSKNQIKNIGIVLEKCIYLEKLTMNNNQIEEVLIFNKLASLEYLELSLNKIRKIEGLQNFQCLKWLDLSNNKIEQIFNKKQVEFLEKVKQIFKFSSTLPQSPRNNLLVLQQQRNRPSLTKRLTVQQSLNLSNKSIKSVKQQVDYIFNHQSSTSFLFLKNLYLSENRLKNIYPIYAPKLQIIHLKSNFLTSESVSQFLKKPYPGLKQISLSNNIKINRLPLAFSQKSLQQFYCSESRIQNINQVFQRWSLPYIRIINLAGSSYIKKLPNIQKLSSLRQLNLRECPIENYDQLVRSQGYLRLQKFQLSIACEQEQFNRKKRFIQKKLQKGNIKKLDISLYVQKQLKQDLLNESEVHQWC